MAYSKAVVDFSKYQDGDLTAPAKKVYDNMLVTNIASFTGTPIDAAAFLLILNAWIEALANSLKGGTDCTTIKNDARTALEDALFQLGSFVNVKANGSQATVDLSGFPSYTTERVQSQGGVTFIPLNVRWEDGNVSGQAVLRWKGDGTHSNYEVQTCTGDPNVEANWTYRGSFSGGKAQLDGFTPGAIIWGRVRKIGTAYQVGAWSDPAQIRAS